MVLNTSENSPHFQDDSFMMQAIVAKHGAYNIIKIISDKAFSGVHEASAAKRPLRGTSSPLLDCPSE